MREAARYALPRLRKGQSMIGNLSVLNSQGERVPLEYRPVDQIGAEKRATFFTKRSIKKSSKLDGLYAVIQMMDLTTLEGADTPDKVRHLCRRAVNPVAPEIFEELKDKNGFREIPSVGAVCVYPNWVSLAAELLEGTGVGIASVATSFPSGQLPLDMKLREVEWAVGQGATEVDMVINRGAYLSGRYQDVFDEIVETKKACGHAHLKVILETGELASLDRVRMASQLAMEAGADFIKTSTGKVSPAATMPVTLVMLQAIAEFHKKTGRKIGMKPAGGIRTSKQAIHYLCMLGETLGPDWMTPDLFRFGASSLLDDVLKQIYKLYTGSYYYDRGF